MAITKISVRGARQHNLKNVSLEIPRNKLTVITSQELDSAKLDPYDAVFLCNVTDFTESTLTAFADYLKRGGGLVFFPGGICYFCYFPLCTNGASLQLHLYH